MLSYNSQALKISLLQPKKEVLFSLELNQYSIFPRTYNAQLMALSHFFCKLSVTLKAKLTSTITLQNYFITTRKW